MDNERCETCKTPINRWQVGNWNRGRVRWCRTCRQQAKRDYNRERMRRLRAAVSTTEDVQSGQQDAQKHV